jgi:two-component system nitrogen regulation sensor histidine kinase GlnL
MSRRELARPDPLRLLNALPQPLLALDAHGSIVEVNTAAETFFEMGRGALTRSTLRDLLPFGSPVFALIADALESQSLPSTGGVAVLLQERSIAEKMDRQLTHRSAARSVTALGSMLAHEIKNPLSGIRGAAQLLETSVSDEDRALTQLICAETDRIVTLVDRMESFGDERPAPRDSLNIHAVLDHVKRLGQAGFARHIRVTEIYDPSLPHVLGNRDQLVQVFLNLLKNAAEAIGPDAIDGEIVITTAYRHGMRLKLRASSDPVSLPLEICIRDNGGGVVPEIAANLFDPFVTTKANGSGLGLALVAKVIGDHGGIIECESLSRKTTFRVLLPVDHGPRRLES